MSAAFSGSERCIRLLIHKGANVNVTDKTGIGPLHKAAEKVILLFLFFFEL